MIRQPPDARPHRAEHRADEGAVRRRYRRRRHRRLLDAGGRVEPAAISVEPLCARSRCADSTEFSPCGSASSCAATSPICALLTDPANADLQAEARALLRPRARRSCSSIVRPTMPPARAAWWCRSAAVHPSDRRTARPASSAITGAIAPTKRRPAPQRYLLRDDAPMRTHLPSGRAPQPPAGRRAVRRADRDGHAEPGRHRAGPFRRHHNSVATNIAFRQASVGPISQRHRGGRSTTCSRRPWHRASGTRPCTTPGAAITRCCSLAKCRTACRTSSPGTTRRCRAKYAGGRAAGGGGRHRHQDGSAVGHRAHLLRCSHPAPGPGPSRSARATRCRPRFRRPARTTNTRPIPLPPIPNFRVTVRVDLPNSNTVSHAQAFLR